MSTEWTPCDLFKGKPRTPYAIIILNQAVNRNALDAVIDTAELLVCADGGANRLYAYENDPTTKIHRVPDAIIGDLDSLDVDVRKYYEGKGVEIVKVADQFSTDFTKCLKWLRATWSESRKGTSNDDNLDVLVCGGLGGRVDQGLSQIHHLYMAATNDTLLKGRIYLLSEFSLSFVLANNLNIIHVEPGFFQENVGVIPVVGLANITLKGFEWDVEDWPTEFGGQISTSNHIRADKLEISFSGPNPLFTMELDRRLAASHPR